MMYNKAELPVLIVDRDLRLEVEAVAVLAVKKTLTRSAR
jgi:hypothetical protein